MAWTIRTVFAFALALAALAGSPAAAFAGEAADWTRAALESGDLAAGEAKLAARLDANAGDDEARLGLGAVRFVAAVQRFAETEYHYGFTPIRRDLPIGADLNPLPPNPKPDPLSYEDQRAILQALLDDFAKVDATLASLGDSDASLTLDLYAIRLNVTGANAPEARPTLGALIAGFGAPRGAPPPANPDRLEAVFDRADALWLRGYLHAISAGLEFALAYDWRESFDRYAFLFYSGATPSTGAPVPPPAARRPMVMPGEESVLDVVGFIHSIHWRCVEPERMRKAREHFKTVVALNRAIWPIALARKDDRTHWIPAPGQKSLALPSLELTPEKLKAWQGAVDEFDALLDGDKLAPFWRYDLGIDFRAFFEKPSDFDLVYWLTGPGAWPYLRAGPTMTAQEWNAMQAAFGGNFLKYLVWLN